MSVKVKNKKKNKGSVQELAWLLIFIFSLGLIGQSSSYAGGGGPTQPEVQGFTPIGVSDMVDPFTGDFTYNIPLMDVEGYPINIAYNSGVSMDQESSWVGLGWNLNVGSILRNMRGLPDDFKGDVIEKTRTSKTQTDFSLKVNLGVEVFGNNFLENINSSNSLNLSSGMTINYSNYTGWGANVDMGASYSLKKNGKSSNFGLNLTGSSENGAGFSPSFSRSTSDHRNESKDYTLTNSFSSGFNSRAGLTDVSFGASLKRASSKKIQNLALNPSFNVGLKSYTPSSNPRYTSSNFAGSMTTTGSLFGVDGQLDINFTANESRIDPQFVHQMSPAYGYFHLNAGQQNHKALLDFNRDNDGQFNQYTPYLPSAFLTSDLFSVQAQGIGGSYRGFRNEVGYVFDPISETSSTSGTFGFEYGFGNTADLSIDISGSLVKGYAGPWTGGTNEASNVIKFENATDIRENFALQEAGERSVDTDPLFGTVFSKAYAEKFSLAGIPRFTKVRDELPSGTISTNNRNERIKRNQVMSYLTIKELKAGLGLDNPNPNLYSGAVDHHIGEITQLGTDGRRYIFGLPAYNLIQEDATFAIGDELGNDNGGIFPTNQYNGLVDLGNNFDEAASVQNEWGIDHFYSAQKTPAYAHSYLLTAVISDDYVDSDDEKGPSENDLGSYVKVDYQKVTNVKWRTPMPNNSAYYNEGLKSDKKDDKASFVYGKKELYYVKKIETKNYVAVFVCASRFDGTSADNRSGGFDPTAGKMMCLKKICLYTKKEFDAHESNLDNAQALQEVHFDYDYSLCQGYPANLTGGGKLTLKEIYFVYQGSYKMKRSSYKFEYNGGNANYNIKAVDRWGTYQATGTGQYDIMEKNDKMPQGDFPYTTQDTTIANANASQWNLTDIFLPSGGRIKVEYESDDYAYVQNVRASQMFPIVATGDVDGNMNFITDINAINIQPISKSDNKNRTLFFKLKPGYSNINEYGKKGQMIYFKCLVNMKKDPGNTFADWEYVSGYALIDSISIQGGYGKIKLKGENLIDSANDNKYSPLTKTAIQFARMNLSRTINDLDINGPDNNSEAGILNAVAAIGSAYASFGELITGPNLAIYKTDKCQDILTNRSFIRLIEPSKSKLGGGSRVKKIKMFDHWKEMANSTGTPSSAEFTYGQEFTYKLEDGTSSGVATYEPAIGGDENSIVQARKYSEKIKFAPDNDMFFEVPLMESQFPNPSVGYSRVVIKDLKPNGVSNLGTGKVVKEFYTAKDFPVIAKSSGLEYKQSSSFLPLLPKYEFMTASQGFYLELNDMHGKPKGEAVFGENQTQPLSSVQYDYLKKDIVVNGSPGFNLLNEVTIINSDGTSEQAEIGVKYEAVADFRETNTESIGVGPIEVNTNSFFAGPWFFFIPILWGKIDIAEDRFRSATLNKVVNKFGIVNRVTANQDGSIVETNNLAYDAETGEVLVTQTTNNFNDAVYSLNIPAHWKYDELGMAYKNIGYNVVGFPIYADGFMPVGALSANFVEGDEVIVSNFQGAYSLINGWVTEVTSSGIRIVDKAGNPVVSGNAYVKIIRSGRRNKQTTSMASITTNDNPIAGLTSEMYSNVLNAGAIEYSEDWETFCDCFSEGENSNPTKNPFVRGTRGNWRPIKSYTYLTNRTQSFINSNSNIRRDGVFESFSPYYYFNNGQWSINPSNWTFVSEVTQFSPNGATLETRDALGRYSASLMSYRNTLTTAVASNSKLEQVAEGSFEDVDYLNCMDQSIFAKVNPSYVSSSQSHSGRSSVHVAQNTSISFGEVVEQCNSDNSCNLNLTALSGNTYQIIGAFDGSASTVISGSGSMNIVGNVLTVSFSNAHYFEMIVELSDKPTNCGLKVKFFNTPGNLNQLNMQILSVTQN
jgi:hypothetical protein